MKKKEIQYKGFTITIEKITGYVATIEDGKGEVVNDENWPLSDLKSDAIEGAKEFVDAISGIPPKP